MPSRLALLAATGTVALLATYGAATAAVAAPAPEQEGCGSPVGIVAIPENSNGVCPDTAHLLYAPH